MVGDVQKISRNVVNEVKDTFHDPKPDYEESLSFEVPVAKTKTAVSSNIKDSSLGITGVDSIVWH